MREGVELDFIFERKDKKLLLQSWKGLPQALLSSVAASPLDLQHLPSAWAVLMDLGVEKAEFVPGKNLLAACFSQTWSEMCQGGQGQRQRVPRVSRHSQHWRWEFSCFSLVPFGACGQSGREMNPPHEEPAGTVT